MELYCSEYMVEHVTPRGCKIMAHNSQGNWGLKSVMDYYINKFAYPTKAEALLGFIARKQCQQTILYRQLANSKEAQTKAERLLAKELE